MTFDSRISMVTLGVADVAVSTAFYERLGFRKSSSSNENITFFKTAGTVLGLYGRQALAEDVGIETAPLPQADATFNGVALAYNCSSEAEVDRVYQHAVDCGATPVKPPQKVFWGGYSSYVADPDGHLWELAYNPFSPNDENGHMQLPD